MLGCNLGPRRHCKVNAETGQNHQQGPYLAMEGVSQVHMTLSGNPTQVDKGQWVGEVSRRMATEEGRKVEVRPL